MLYKAVVLDNSMFFTRGTIRIRIAGFYNKEMIWNLEEKFPDVVEEGNREDATQFSNDYEAYVSTGLGGGRNYGILTIPQPNEKGIVAFMGNSKKYPIWLGAIFEPTRNEDFDVEFVNFPSDKFVDGENSDGILAEGESNFAEDEPPEEKNIIIRTKNTSIDAVENIDFQQQDTTNIISVGKRKVRISHFPEGSWEEGEPNKVLDFIIGLNEDSEEVISLAKKKIDKDNGDTYSQLVLKEEEGNLSFYKEGSAQNEIKFDSEQVFITKKNEEDGISTEITMSNESLMLKVIGDEEITLILEGDTITVTAPNFHFDGEKFEIAGGSDNVSLYTPLETVLNELLTHQHTAPSGPTTPAEKSDKSPLVSLKADVMKIKSETSTTD